MPEVTPARAIVIDPEPFFYERLRGCLSRGRYATTDAPNAETALQYVDDLHPHLLILGPHLEEQTAFALSREIARREPNAKAVLFTAHGDDPLFQIDAAYSHIAACLSRSTTDEQILAILTEVMQGRLLFPSEIVTSAFQPIELTRREHKVLERMAEGKTDQEIAHALGLKGSTVRNYSQHILQKFSVKERREAVWRARRRGMVGREGMQSPRDRE